ncbi:peptidoglycan glycosyltransferase [Polymorphobacter multimanifer]|uniref:peptidoglycan D,D-transpeptidase FtsI family protein n=1 Tax=Polymorphobacter multimanifer TaxID=1070431 RepID=UPI0019926F3E|nr:penicillin-binding protein 2 [Polymorphobacter multimanifer]GGI93333.1 peptidoglycan glycosyltransferase [Polymorphobacter multimanifer]
MASRALSSFIGGVPGLGAQPELPAMLPGQRQAAQRLARQRLVIVMVMFLAVPLVFAGRLFDLGVLEAQPVSRSGIASSAPPRGDIVDRNGLELARTFEAYAISVEPQKLASDPRRLARDPASILTGSDEAQLYDERTHKGRFRYLARRVLPSEAQAINDLGEPAIYLRREAERLYPNFSLAAHVIGYPDDEGRGKVGLELAFDEQLSAPATRGQPLQLALDLRVQQALEHELGTLYRDQKAQGAVGIVMDVDSGEVVAMTSLPDFNPNAPGLATDDGRYNKASFATYELGSTFKALTIASGLDAGTISTLQKRYDATRPIQMGRFRIRDDHAKNRWLTVPEIFIHSSNIGTARIAVEAGRDVQYAMLEKLGFFKPIEIELPERARPQFPSLERWGELSTMTIAYGHGISVPPMHLASAYATLVNGGIYRAPTLLTRDVPGPGIRVFKAETSETMRKLLRLTVTKGTGRRANAPGYRVGGKTGTAEKIASGRYVRGANVSTFAAAFPMDAPRYVVIAMVDDPRGSKESAGFRTAGMVVAPAISRLVSRIGPMLGVQPDSTREIDMAGLLPEPPGANPAAVVE